MTDPRLLRSATADVGTVTAFFRSDPSIPRTTGVPRPRTVNARGRGWSMGRRWLVASRRACSTTPETDARGVGVRRLGGDGRIGLQYPWGDGRCGRRVVDHRRGGRSASRPCRPAPRTSAATMCCSGCPACPKGSNPCSASMATNDPGRWRRCSRERGTAWWDRCRTASRRSRSGPGRGRVRSRWSTTRSPGPCCPGPIRSRLPARPRSTDSGSRSTTTARYRRRSTGAGSTEPGTCTHSRTRRPCRPASRRSTSRDDTSRS